MNKFFHSVYLNEDKCKGCINCIKRCPTQAIRVRNGKASIIQEFCTDCGECIRHCPHHAKLTHRDAIDILEQYEYTVALPAPSLYSQFNNLQDVNIVLTALKLMGFHDVYEVSAGAEIVTSLTKKYIRDHKERWPVISTACPTVERLIRVRFPKLIEHMLPVMPPVEVAAILARKRAVEQTGLQPHQIGVIFISPCPAKVTFIKSPIGLKKSHIDGALAIKDIYPILLSYMDKASEHTEQLQLSGRIGVSWGVSGGESKALSSDNFLYADGIENIIRVLEDLEDEKMNPELNFIELDACSGGCVGGVLQVENPYAARAKMKYLNHFLPKRTPEETTQTLDAEDTHICWNERVEYEPVFRLGDNIMESMQYMSEVDRLQEKLPGLDCGSCGAPTCHTFAVDVVRGIAHQEDCIYLLKDYYEALKNYQNRKEKTNESE
jgi:iron only hydrogenase large subunit-like protein